MEGIFRFKVIFHFLEYNVTTQDFVQNLIMYIERNCQILTDWQNRDKYITCEKRKKERKFVKNISG